MVIYCVIPFALMSWQNFSINAIVILTLSYSCTAATNINMARIIGGSNADPNKWNFVVAIYVWK